MKDLDQQEYLERQSHRLEFFEENYSLGPLDFVFPYHIWMGKVMRVDEEIVVYPSLKFYTRHKINLIWMHHRKFASLYSKEELRHRDACEERQFNYNLGLKGVALLLLANIRLGRQASRPLIVNLMLGYWGVYSLILSSFLGIRQVYDPKLDQMAQKIVANRNKVPPSQIFEGGQFDPLKVKVYKFDSIIAQLF
uniref:Uncharacterized protein n=1 Tax=Strombidium rassoulzadegani TaxID=1082188 RepID=A0A7S3CJV5_9SPIT